MELFVEEEGGVGYIEEGEGARRGREEEEEEERVLQRGDWHVVGGGVVSSLSNFISETEFA